jgi:ATP phosphoribosyltransferase regulatory subunit
VLEVSHLDVVSHVLDAVGAEGEMRAELLRFVAEKNTHDIRALCASCGWDAESVEPLCALVAVSGTPSSVRAQLDALSAACPSAKGAMEELYDAIGQLEAEGFGTRLRIDFSLINDMNYYNGIVFRGYIQGVPTRILSGGRYDGLMQKMGKRASAIGFAVYLDLLDGLNEPPAEYDVDTVVLYGATTPTARVRAAVDACVSAGERALALRELTDGLRYRELVDLRGDKCCE